jgi:uracil-DNA glycosylase family 4
VAGGSLDSDEIGPYALWHGDLDAQLMIVAKDFAPVPHFIRNAGRPGARVRTNLRLSRLLELAGFSPGAIGEQHRKGRIFMTNAVLCLPGGVSMRTVVRAAELRECSTRFLARTMAVIRPRVVAALGGHAVRAVLHASELSPNPQRIGRARSEAGLTLPDGVVCFAMPHPVASCTLDEHKAAWVKTWFECQGD